MVNINVAAFVCFLIAAFSFGFAAGVLSKVSGGGAAPAGKDKA